MGLLRLKWQKIDDRLFAEFQSNFRIQKTLETAEQRVAQVAADGALPEEDDAEGEA